MPRVGAPYECERRPMWSDGNDPAGPPEGYYPVGADGNPKTKIRLRWVDDAPDAAHDGAGHFEVMPRQAGVGYYHGTSRGEPLPAGATVPLEAHAKGKARSGGRLAAALTKVRYLLGPPR